MSGIRLAVFATHPIQYQAPLFRALAENPRLDLRVYFAMKPDRAQQGVGFGVDFEWDLSLLDGYDWTLLDNKASEPSLEKFGGCNVPGIAKILKADRPDVALITGWNSLYLLQAALACRRLRIPTLARGESNTFRNRDRFRLALLKALVRRFDAFLSIGKSNRDFYRNLGIEDKRIFPCPYFIDNTRFQQQADEYRPRRAEFREGWGIPEDAITFLFVGKLIPKKRIMDFILAVEQASGLNPAIYGLVVGTGEQMEEAKAYTQAHEVPVRFAGFLNQNDIAAAYVAADVLALPSDSGETWGLVVNEAMACGLPAIVSDQVGCGPDLIREGETGFVYPMGDVTSLAKCMIRLANDRDATARMGREARSTVSEGYSIARAAQGVMSGVDFLASD